MPGLVSSGWDLTGFGSQAATVDIGVAIGGGRYVLDIKDPQGQQRKLVYGGVTGGGGLGVHSEGAGQFILNFILPLIRGGVNSLDLPSRQSRIFQPQFFSQPPPLTWDGDFVNKIMAITAIGAGGGLGVSGALLLFFPYGHTITSLNHVRGIAFSGGMQVGQVGADLTVTTCMQGALR